MDAFLPPRIDLKLLIHNMGGNEKVIPKLLEVFWESCDDYVKRMEKALLQKDMKAWQLHAHSLKGAALSVTARRIAMVCEEAEHTLTLKNKEGAALLYHLNKEIATLRSELAARQSA